MKMSEAIARGAVKGKPAWWVPFTLPDGTEVLRPYAWAGRCPVCGDRMISHWYDYHERDLGLTCDKSCSHTSEGRELYG